MPDAEQLPVAEPVAEPAAGPVADDATAETEAVTSEVRLVADRAVPSAAGSSELRVDEDGWPLAEDELPEERVAPEQEPPTEEILPLDDDRGDGARAESDEGERIERRPRGGRDDRGRPRRFPRRDAGVRGESAAAGDGAPAGDRPRGGRGVLHFFHPERLDACQRAIGYHFRDVTLLENALTHSSIKSEDRPSYERLEFLGDSVVGLVMSHYLYDALPECDEGELTRIKSAVVSTEGLANAAIECGLDRFLALGRGLLMKEAIPRSLIADVFEGVAGAVYLDRGYETARLYILDHLSPFVDRAISGPETNYKSVLQTIAQRDLGQTPHYDVLSERGSDRSRQFEVAAVLGRRRFPAARAATKRDAEQAAAKIAIQLLLIERGHGARRDGREREGGGGSDGGGGGGSDGGVQRLRDGGRRPRRRREGSRRDDRGRRPRGPAGPTGPTGPGAPR